MRRCSLLPPPPRFFCPASSAEWESGAAGLRPLWTAWSRCGAAGRQQGQARGLNILLRTEQDDGDNWRVSEGIGRLDEQRRGVAVHVDVLDVDVLHVDIQR